MADHAPESHVGTDVAYSDASFLGNGCSPGPGHTEMLSCHDVSNLAAVHSTMPDKGCSVCHGSGNTPKRECLDCHQIGQSVVYNKPGPVVSSTATYYPSSDASIAPDWTWTTTPAAQPKYAVVNSPYPPADTTRYVTVRAPRQEESSSGSSDSPYRRTPGSPTCGSMRRRRPPTPRTRGR